MVTSLIYSFRIVLTHSIYSDGWRLYINCCLSKQCHYINNNDLTWKPVGVNVYNVGNIEILNANKYFCMLRGTICPKYTINAGTTFITLPDTLKCKYNTFVDYAYNESSSIFIRIKINGNNIINLDAIAQNQYTHFNILWHL